MKSATVVLLLGLTAACSGYDGQSEPGIDAEAVGKSEAAITNTDGSYYKPNDTNGVYRLYGGNKFCLVKDPGQLDALQGRSPGNYEGIGTSSERYFLDTLMPSYGRVFQGHCKYPTGCFRKRDEDPIYRVTESTNSFCHLTSFAQVTAYCGSTKNYFNIQRPSGEINFYQPGWYDSGWAYHSANRYKYTGDCP